jgi:hypothetical protein
MQRAGICGDGDVVAPGRPFDLGIRAVFGPGSEKETACQMRSSWGARAEPIAAMGPGPRLECTAVTSNTVALTSTPLA